MVSVSVSKVGKMDLVFVQPGAKINSIYWHVGDMVVGNHLFVIFAVLDVSLAIN